MTIRHTNQVLLIGAVSQTPKAIKYVDKTPVLNFLLAGKDNVLSKDSGIKQMPWYHWVSVFGSNAEIIYPQLQKGQAVLVEGAIKYRTWETDGVQKFAIEIDSNRVELVAGRHPADLAYDNGSGCLLINASNETRVIGNLTRDVETKNLETGLLANLSLAMNKRYQKADIWKTDTTFITATTWREAANQIKDLQKGTTVLVRGRLASESWKDAAGTNKSGVYIDPHFINVLERHSKNQESSDAWIPGLESLPPEVDMPF